METSQLTVMQYQNYWFLYDGNNGLKKANSRFFLALSSQHSQKEFLAKEQVSIFMLYYFTMPQNVLWKPLTELQIWEILFGLQRKGLIHLNVNPFVPNAHFLYPLKNIKEL